jgi:hypothetical protein
MTRVMEALCQDVLVEDEEEDEEAEERFLACGSRSRLQPRYEAHHQRVLCAGARAAAHQRGRCGHGDRAGAGDAAARRGVSLCAAYLWAGCTPCTHHHVVDACESAGRGLSVVRASPVRTPVRAQHVFSYDT